MLSAGTIEVAVTGEFCNHVHADDGWHTFLGDSIRPYVANREDAQTCIELDYLVGQRFVSATYRLDPVLKYIFVRIYLIPYDLPNVEGQLFLRPETVLKPARQYLWRLLPRIDKSREKWDGRTAGSVMHPLPNYQPFLPIKADNRTMAEIYGDLPSPKIVDSSDPRLSRIAHNILTNSGPDGLITDLYAYQQRSVVAMLQKELPNERAYSSEDSQFVDTPDPLFIPIVGVDGQEFYLQPAKMLILQGRPMVSPTRGGILCEELGTGKTLMILTLILATLRDLPAPETSILHSRPPIVLTPLAFRHFPCDFEAERTRVRVGRNEAPLQGTRIPSLVDLLLHNLRVPRGGFQPAILQHHRDELDIRDLYCPLMTNTPFYHHEDENLVVYDRPRRNQSEIGPRVLFLTSATLIVVPTNLQGQWYGEIQKHCDDTSIRVLKVTSKTTIPPAQVLASNFDIVLMTYHRFSAEAAYKDVAKLHSRPPCRCDNFKNSRVPNCKCGHTPGVSPLLQIRWKRLVIDEGHVSASLLTNLTPFARLLSIERRWIVTGTPTTNLLGLSFGQSSELEINDDDELEYDPEGYAPEVSSVATSNSDEIIVARKWTRYDREDLRKFDNMATHFVGVPHFKAEPKRFGDHVTMALFGPERLPLPGAIQVLNQVMQSVMIRHRTEDVERDIVLPTITIETILLDLDPYAVKAYNAMQAGIAINAVDSERKDLDYLFHPRNAELLRVTVAVMSQVLFWSFDARMYNVDEMARNAPTTLKNAVERNVSRQDMSLLEDAIHAARSAAEDSLWREMQAHEDVPFRVYNLKEQIFDAWSRTAKLTNRSSDRQIDFMHRDRLIKLRDQVLSRPLISVDALVMRGHAAAQEELEDRQNSVKSSPKKRSRSDQKGHNKDSTTQSKAARWAKSGAGAEKIKEVRKELAAALKRLEGLPESGDIVSSPSRAPRIEKANSRLLSSSLLAHVRVGSSCSTKLNYILNEVLEYAAEEKFLIFSDSPLSLSHVAEGLNLINVKYLQFTTQVVPQVREQLVTTFETSDTYRVFLMELRHGARGLNLISASRVIFCEPVWQADVESQAIKRVHRIGQTRPVCVKTLAIRSTAEENMMARREALKGKDGRLPKLTEEVGMRHYIANPKFIKHTPTMLSTLDIPLIGETGDTGESTEPVVVSLDEPGYSGSHKRVGFAEEVQRDWDVGSSPKKKPKTGVRFVE